MGAKFEVGQMVYHRNLKWHGIFNGYDIQDTDTCYVAFIADSDYVDERRVSINLLESSKQQAEEK